MAENDAHTNTPGQGGNPAHTRHLVGVGVGPGDPELLTLAALHALQQADVILVPATEKSDLDGVGRAERIVLGADATLATKIVHVPFSMSQRRGLGAKRTESWQASATAALKAFDEGAGMVVLATVGDPSVYSTFSYLRGTVAAQRDDVDFSVIPGITAMQALAAASDLPLVEGREILALVPATVGLERLDAVLDVADSVTIYKGGRTLPEVISHIKAHNRTAVVGTDISGADESLIDADQLGADQTLPYFSTVLSVPTRRTTGGAL